MMFLVFYQSTTEIASKNLKKHVIFSINTKDNFNQNELKLAAFTYNSSKNNVLRFPVATVRSIIPTKANAIPIEQINTYFQAASIECLVLWK